MIAVSRWLTPQLLTTPGAFSELLKKVRSLFYNEIERVRKDVESYEKQLEERARQKKEVGPLGGGATG
jgi:hypothetical protein